jgi:50S ribosomal protein L16 3-hydroxylase
MEVALKTREPRQAAASQARHGTLPRSDQPLRLLGGRSPRAFLQRYWQRRPLLLRAALPNFRDPLDADELAGLACEPEVESRLVMVRGGHYPWQLIEGPQDPERLRRLPRTHWSLLVQECNQHVPALRELLELFDFVPNWRVDDVMVSFAPRGGTVGPHVDSYDVFLLQGRGRRRWQVDTRARPRFRAGLDLRILERFEPRQEWVLEPGDMLYLPPGVGHHGVSLEDALTYSIGFRAPSQIELLMGTLQQAVGAIDADARYRDAGRAPALARGEIAPEDLAQVAGTIRAALDTIAGQPLEAIAGRLLTQSRSATPTPPARALDARTLGARLRGGASLRRAEASRLAFALQPAGLWLFVDGRAEVLQAGLAEAVALLCGPRRLSAEALQPHLARPGFMALLTRLFNAGVLVPDGGWRRRPRSR